MNRCRNDATRPIRIRRRRRGSAVMELALVAMVLLWLTFGCVEFGYYFFVKNTLQGAAREGCRAGIVPTNTNTEVTDAVVKYLWTAGLQTGSTTLDSSKFSLTITPAANAVTAGGSLTVRIDSAWGTVGRGFRPMGLIGATKTVTGVTVMRKES
jgi:Flp pilus assembly protein TadG